MERKELEKEIIALIKRTFPNAGEVTAETRFKEDLKAASIMMVSLSAAIENELDIMIPLADVSKSKTVAELVDEAEKNQEE